MTAFVILAAGKGSRIGHVGDYLHKALVPLDGKAIISHLFDLAPHDAKIIVCVAHRAEQIRDYVRLAHPQLDVTFVDVNVKDNPYGIGPGASLLAARDVMSNDEDLIVTCCDTLWTKDKELWANSGNSWLAIAPMPAGTQPNRWCRIAESTSHENTVGFILDKTISVPDATDVWTGLAFIKNKDLLYFWTGLEHGISPAGHENQVSYENQVSSGFLSIHINDLTLETRRIQWTDVGDDTAYRRAVAKLSGYDWTKIGKATYVLPREGRVVKFDTSNAVTEMRATRGKQLSGVVPENLYRSGSMFAYDYVPGISLYELLERDIRSIIDVFYWWKNSDAIHINAFDLPFRMSDNQWRSYTKIFYKVKTKDRIKLLHTPELQREAHSAVIDLNWDQLAEDTCMGRPHGDFTFSNIIVKPSGSFVAIDWREKFITNEYVYVEKEHETLGDIRYDLAKMMSSTRVHWKNAEHGDFRPWKHGARLEQWLSSMIKDAGYDVKTIKTLAALCLINSAPLHVAPFDEILVARGCAWLEELS